MDTSITRSTCPYCGVGCGVLAKTDRDGRVTIAGDPDHPANFGRLCSKGLSLGETFGPEQRLLAPRVGGVDVEWDVATALVAEKFTKAIRDHGPDSVAFYVSGQFLTEDYYVANKLMKGFIGSANIDTNSRLCMASAVAGYKRAFGADIVPCSYTDLEDADLVVLVGSNLAWCHPVLFQRLQAAREKRGTKLVVIDPRRTTTAESADMFLQIKPGSDVSLFNGLMRHLYTCGNIDKEFVAGCTQGLSDVLLTVHSHDVTRVAADTGLSVSQLQSFYELFADTKKTVTGFSMGVNQAIDGTDKVNAIINCHLLTGRIGKAGAGPFSITGQPNAMGGREVGGLANMLAAHMDIGNPTHRQAVQDFWKAPHIAEKPGLKAVDLFDAVASGKIKALWVMATNPAVSMPDSHHIAAALQTCPFVVVSDVTAQTDTAQYAHVLLPAKGWGEKDGTVTNSERRISRQRSFIGAVGAARSDWKIMCDVARKMGFPGFNFKSASEIFEEHVALTGVLNAGSRLLDLTFLADFDYDDLQPMQWGGGRPFANGRYETDDGKAWFVPTLARVQELHEDFTTLNTGRIRDQWHTMTRTGLVPKLFGHRAEPYVEISREDARRLNIEDADLVAVKGVNGTSVVRALIGDLIGSSQVFQPMHWSGIFASAGRANSASARLVDSISGQPALKSSEVILEKFPAAWFGFGVSSQGLDLEADYWSKRPLAAGISFECAGREIPLEWSMYLASHIGFEARGLELSVVASSTVGSFRCAAFQSGVLRFAFFAAARPVAVSRNWLQDQLGTQCSAMDVLAARPKAAQIDAGPIVCVCNNVGRNSIVSAIAGQAHATLATVCATTSAGTGCGSCRPEIQGLIQRFAAVAIAAE